MADDLLTTGGQQAVAGRTGWFVQPSYRASSECKVPIGSFELHLRELAGLTGDFGTLLPRAIVGVMMLMVGIEMFKFTRRLRFNLEIALGAITVGGYVTSNMAAGFVAALTVRYLLVRRQGGATDGER